MNSIWPLRMWIGSDDGSCALVGFIPCLVEKIRRWCIKGEMSFLCLLTRIHEKTFILAYLALNHNSGTFGFDLFPHELTGRRGDNNGSFDAELSASVGNSQTGISARGADQVGLVAVLLDSLLADVTKTSVSSRGGLAPRPGLSVWSHLTA